MKRTLRRICAAAAFIVTASAITVGGTTVMAQADEASASTPQPCSATVDMSSGNGSCYTDVLAESYSHDEAHGHVRSVNGIKFHGVTKTHVLSFIQTHGATHAQMQNPNRITLHTAGCYNTSYFNVAGQEVWHNKCYAAGKTFVKGSDGFYHDPNCWNKVTGLPKGPAKPPTKHIQLHGHYKVVKVFKFSGSAKAVLHDSASATAQAWANGYLYDSNGNLVYENGQPVRTCHAEASGHGGASFRAVGKARISGRIYISVEAAVSAMVSGANADLDVKLGGQTHADVTGKVWADARGNASATASAQAICNDTHETTQPQQKPSVTIGQKNDVDVNNTATVCADYNVPSSDPGTLTFTSSYGSWPGGKTFSVSGSGTKCTTYKAPSEVPPSGYDTLTVSLTDNTTGLADDTPSDNSTRIRINPAPQPPM